MIWADGHGQGLAETIDPLVYVRLVTSSGSLFGQAVVEDDEIQWASIKIDRQRMKANSAHESRELTQMN